MVNPEKDPNLLIGSLSIQAASAISRWQGMFPVIHCAFEWRARTSPFRLERICDTLENGEGKLSVKALGRISLALFEPSSALTRGQLIRYLAELPLAPDATICNDRLVRRSPDQNRPSIGPGTGDKAAEVIVTLDHDGLVGEVFADRRHAVGSNFVSTPRLGHFSGYRMH